MINYAHRGASDYAPENTLSSFYLGLLQGANGIETDVQMTKDGEIIVMHDDNLKRTTGVDKNVWEVTYDEIKDLDNGSFFSKEYAGTKIPTLEEAIRFCKGRMYINIDQVCGIDTAPNGTERNLSSKDSRRTSNVSCRHAKMHSNPIRHWLVPQRPHFVLFGKIRFLR